jgi:hypothetical protein
MTTMMTEAMIVVDEEAACSTPVRRACEFVENRDLEGPERMRMRKHVPRLGSS